MRLYIDKRVILNKGRKIPCQFVVVREVIDDLEVVHSVAGVDGEQIAASLGGGPVELPIVVYGIIVGRGNFYGVIFKEGQSIKVCQDMSEDAK